MKKRINILILVAILATVSCKTMKNADKNTAKIDVEVGSEFTITVKSNPTTGFIWSYEASDSTTLHLKSKRYIADPNPNKVSGMGGVKEWVFVADKKGKAQLVFNYKRANEIAQLAYYKIKVK